MAVLPLFGSLPQGIRQALASNKYPFEFDRQLSSIANCTAPTLHDEHSS
jgi:hypothetical protein